MAEPVFILAPPRSYSTVSLAILAGHPEIFGFPEMLLFGHPTVQELLVEGVNWPDMPPWVGVTRLNGICRAIAEVKYGHQGSHEIAQARDWLERRSDWSPADVMRYLLKQIHPLIGLEKSPETVFGDAPDRCMQEFPKARYIHLTRHPVTSHRSLLEHWHQAHRHLTLRSRSIYCARSWSIGHRNILQALNKVSSERWIRIRSEDLLRDPQNVAARVYDWLDLSYNEEILRELSATERWRFANTGECGTLFGGDAKFMLSPQLRRIEDPGPVKFPSEWMLSAEIRQEVSRLARHLGYE
jgi:Sulfotransferase family